MAALFTGVTSLVSGGGINNDEARQYTFEALTAILVASFQYMFQKTVFKCPEYYYTEYSLLLLLAPAFLFYCFAIFNHGPLQNELRGIFNGCFNRRIRNLRMLKLKWKSLLYGITVKYIRCLLAPMVWIVLSLLQDEIYTCAKLGIRRNDDAGTWNATDKASLSLSIAEAESHIIGMCLLIIPVLVITIIVTTKRCLKNTLVQFHDLEKVTRHEADHARQYFEDKMMELAEINARKKVEMLIKNVNTQSYHNESNENDDLSEMSYGEMILVREQLMDAYPSLENNEERKISKEAIKVLKREVEFFKDILRDRSISISLLGDSIVRNSKNNNQVNISTNERESLIIQDHDV